LRVYQRVALDGAALAPSCCEEVDRTALATQSATNNREAQPQAISSFFGFVLASGYLLRQPTNPPTYSSLASDCF
jgi:hypothetical protein